MRKYFIPFFFFLLFLFFSPSVGSVEAAVLKLDPSAVSVASGQTISLNINIETGEDKVVASDIYLLYDTNLLDFQSVTKGNFFNNITQNTSVPGKLYINATIADALQAKSGTGTVAAVNFSTKNSGSSTLSFECQQGSNADSNIVKNDQNATDVIVCAANGSATVQITSSQGLTPTPTPTVYVTATPSPTQTPTAYPTIAATQLPRTGIIDDLLKLLVFGGTLTFLGLVSFFTLL